VNLINFQSIDQSVSSACDVLSEAHNGCKIENSQCICSFGCKSEFRYTTKKECTDALKVSSFEFCCLLFSGFLRSYMHARSETAVNCVRVMSKARGEKKCFLNFKFSFSLVLFRSVVDPIRVGRVIFAPELHASTEARVFRFPLCQDTNAAARVRATMDRDVSVLVRSMTPMLTATPMSASRFDDSAV
jgi:hypothetical protein